MLPGQCQETTALLLAKLDLLRICCGATAHLDLWWDAKWLSGAVDESYFVMAAVAEVASPVVVAATAGASAIATVLLLFLDGLLAQEL